MTLVLWFSQISAENLNLFFFVYGQFELDTELSLMLIIMDNGQLEISSKELVYS